MTSRAPTVVAVIPTGFGINCEAETAHAFERVGAVAQPVHLNDLITNPGILSRAGILALAGGFSFGDHLGAGKALANRLRRRLGESISRFVADGGLVLGICNGFQTLVRLGLVPGGQLGPQTAALAPNRHGCFHDGWVTLAVDPDSPCVFTRGLSRIELPVRHGEGRLVTAPDVFAAIQASHLAPMRYVDPISLEATDVFPQNPNGSLGAIAGLCDPSGRVFGLMPHPEAFAHPENHPQWRGNLPRATDGLVVFRNAVEAAHHGA